MAKSVQIPIEVVDQFSSKLDSLDKGLSNIEKSTKKQKIAFALLSADIIARYGGAALNAVIGFGKESVKAFQDQENANNRLQVAMRNLGVFSEEAFRRQTALSDALAKTTTFQDEQITETQAQLTQFGLYGEALDRATRMTLDLAEAQKIDLGTASDAIGKAFLGNTGRLVSYGIQVNETKDRAAKFEDVLRQISDRMGGSAAAATQTQQGQLKQLGNAYGELKEKIGEIITQSDVLWSSIHNISSIIQVTTNLLERAFPAKSLEQYNLKLKEVQDKISEIEKLSGPLQLALGLAFNYKDALDYNQLLARRDDLIRKIDQETKKLAKTTENMKPPPLPTDQDHQKLVLQLQKETQARKDALMKQSTDYIEHAVLSDTMQKDVEAKRLQTKLEADGLYDQANQVALARNLEREKQANAMRLANLSHALGMISSLSTAKTKELAAIGKAAAIATATIETYKGASMALGSVPPPFSFGLAAAVIAAGMANVARIVGTPLKRGGLVRGSAGGTQATIGEEGMDEAVLPLENSGAMRRIGEAISGAGGSGGKSAVFNFNGGINITVSGNADLGDRGSRQSLVKQIADELKNATTDAIMMARRAADLNTLYASRAA